MYVQIGPLQMTNVKKSIFFLQILHCVQGCCIEKIGTLEIHTTNDPTLSNLAVTSLVEKFRSRGYFSVYTSTIST